MSSYKETSWIIIFFQYARLYWKHGPGADDFGHTPIFAVIYDIFGANKVFVQRHNSLLYSPWITCIINSINILISWKGPLPGHGPSGSTQWLCDIRWEHPMGIFNSLTSFLILPRSYISKPYHSLGPMSYIQLIEDKPNVSNSFFTIHMSHSILKLQQAAPSLAMAWSPRWRQSTLWSSIAERSF